MTLNTDTKIINAGGWTIETIHDVLAKSRSEGWQLHSVIHNDNGEMILQLVRLRSA